MYRKTIGRGLKKVGGLLTGLAGAISPSQSSERARVIDEWWAQNGDKTHRLDYPLGKESLVFDLGGYEGQWASDIFARYRCSIHIFEPVKEYFDNIVERFKGNDRIVAHDIGLGSKTRDETIAIDADGSSIFKSGSNGQKIRLVSADEYFKENGIENIDLMKINIEGGEYELLEHLVQCEHVKKIENIQVQFHEFIPDAKLRMNRIKRDLEKTHYLTYEYPFVWENWRRR
jgi:FkbM family methyltransferase